MAPATNARDIALGLTATGARVGIAVGRVALLPARVVARAPVVRSVVARTEEQLASEGAELRARGRSELESAANEIVASPEVERTVDGVLAGPLPDSVARSIVAHRVAERVVEQITSSPEFEEAIDRALASRLTADITDRALHSAEVQRAVEEIAASPAVRAALTRQTTTLADEVVDAARRRTAAWDDGVQRKLGREAAAGYGGLLQRAAAFGIDLGIALALFLAGAALAALASSLVGDLRPGWFANVLVGVWWTLVVGGYFVVFWTLTGQTPAMRLMRMRVVGRDGASPGFGRSVVRFVGILLAIVPLFAGFLPMLFDRRRRGLQDFLAGTTVVRPEESPAAGTEVLVVAHDAAKPDVAG
jgi:uncharacterized RDD family membrane protein YckC